MPDIQVGDTVHWSCRIPSEGFYQVVEVLTAENGKPSYVVLDNGVEVLVGDVWFMGHGN